MGKRGMPAGRGRAVVADIAGDVEELAETPSPTGTVIGSPVARTGMPRLRPAVDCSATPRTVVSSRCAWTSTVKDPG